VPEVGLEPGSSPGKHWAPTETCGIRPDPIPVRLDTKPRVCTMCTPIFTVPERRTPHRRDAAIVSTGGSTRWSTVESRTRLNPRAVEDSFAGRSNLSALRIFTASTSPQSSQDRIPRHPPDPADEPDLSRYGQHISASRRPPPFASSSQAALWTAWPPAPVTFFVAPVLLQDEGVLACRPRHDCRPQSSMIRGVLSPGSGRCRRDR
jgi:hypothetical protein